MDTNPTEFIKIQRAAAQCAVDAYEEDEEWYPTKTSRLLEACTIIEQLQTKLKAQQSQKEKLVLTLLQIDNYCRVNDIDLDQAMEG